MEILDEELEIYSSPDKNYWELFIGPNADYYIKQWQIFERQDRKISFHIFALFFNVHWLSYRKMYKYAIGSIVLIQSLFFLASLVSITVYQSTFLAILPYTLLGLIGNWLYYKHAKEKIAEIKRQYSDERKREQALKEAGQTNFYAPFILIAFSMIFSFSSYALLDLISS